MSLTPDEEIAALDASFQALNVQYDQLADTLERIARWPAGPHRQACTDKVLAFQNELARRSDLVRDRLNQLLP